MEKLPREKDEVSPEVRGTRLGDELRTDLVGTISHELKTPLTSLRLALYLLLESDLGSLTPEQRELVRGAREDTDRLLRVLDDLLSAKPPARSSGA